MCLAASTPSHMTSDGHMGMVGGPVSYYWHDLSGNLFEKAKSIPSEGTNLDSFVTHLIVMMRWKEGS